MPRCEVGGHLLVCVKASVVVGIAEVAQSLVSTRDGMERLGLHDGINLRCGRPKMVSYKVTIGVGISKNVWASADPLPGKGLTCKRKSGKAIYSSGHGP